MATVDQAKPRQKQNVGDRRSRLVSQSCSSSGDVEAEVVAGRTGRLRRAEVASRVEDVVGTIAEAATAESSSLGGSVRCSSSRETETGLVASGVGVAGETGVGVLIAGAAADVSSAVEREGSARCSPSDDAESGE